MGISTSPYSVPVTSKPFKGGRVGFNLLITTPYLVLKPR